MRQAKCGVRVRVLLGVTTGTVFVGCDELSTSSLDYNRELGVISHSAVVIGAVAGALKVDADTGTRMQP